VGLSAKTLVEFLSALPLVRDVRVQLEGRAAFVFLHMWSAHCALHAVDGKCLTYASKTPLFLGTWWPGLSRQGLGFDVPAWRELLRLAVVL